MKTYDKTVIDSIRDFRRRVLENDIVLGIIGDYHISDNTILEALSKSLPMKPQRNWVFLDNSYELGDCPTCSSLVDSEEQKNYCSWCGQALDWSEENE